MECREAQKLLAQGRETPELLAHLAGCANCRTRGEATEFVRSPPASARPSARMSAPMHIEENEQTYVPPRRGSALPLPWIIGGGAGLVIIAALGVLLLRGKPTPPVDAPPAAKVEVAPAAPSAADDKPAPSEEAPSSAIKHAHHPRHVGGAPAPAHEKAKEEAPADEPIAAGTGTGIGYLSVTSDPWAHVIIDGKDTGRSTPVVKMSLPTGKHKIVLKTSDNSTADFDVTVLKGRGVNLNKNFE